jgi:hypothetical protein
MYVPFRLTWVLFNMDGYYLHIDFYFVWCAWIAFRETDRRDRYEHMKGRRRGRCIIDTEDS